MGLFDFMAGYRHNPVDPDAYDRWDPAGLLAFVIAAAREAIANGEDVDVTPEELDEAEANPAELHDYIWQHIIVPKIPPWDDPEMQRQLRELLAAE